VTGQQPIVTADIYDTHHHALNVCEAQFRSFGRVDSFYGPCVTVKTFEDHLPLVEVMRSPGEGRIVVVDAGGSLRMGVMGDRMAEIAISNGWRGVVIYGAIRDSLGIDQLDIGVKALGTTARRAWIHGGGHQGGPVEVGNVRFETGHWVYADRDSVMVSREALDLSTLTPAAPPPAR
jgi:regulator of ribonuclease activity A